MGFFLDFKKKTVLVHSANAPKSHCNNFTAARKDVSYYKVGQGSVGGDCGG